MTGVGAGACTHALPHTPYVRARARAHPLHLLHVLKCVQTLCSSHLLSFKAALVSTPIITRITIGARARDQNDYALVRLLTRTASAFLLALMIR